MAEMCGMQLCTELFENVCLANLTGSVKDKWFMVSTGLPLKQFRVYFSLHITQILTNKQIKSTKIPTNLRRKYLCLNYKKKVK